MVNKLRHPLNVPAAIVGSLFGLALAIEYAPSFRTLILALSMLSLCGACFLIGVYVGLDWGYEEDDETRNA